MILNIQTSYFAKYRGVDGISISKGTPDWFKGQTYQPLCPPWWLIKSDLPEKEWAEKYHAVILSKLNAATVARELNNKVLLCWEKPEEFCHRRVVAQWLEKELNITVPEIIYESKKSKEKPSAMQLFLF
jgi:hypothetical protein